MKMVKVVNPALCKINGSDSAARAFARIVFEDGKLSICGVVGPTSDGNCRGSAGQCREEIAAGTPAAGWNEEMLKKFSDIWKRWHLNNLKAACEHQRELGWEAEAAQEVTVYYYQLTAEDRKKKDEAEKAALEALRKGETFTPSKEQAELAALPNYVRSIGKELNDPHYEPEKDFYDKRKAKTEAKTEVKTRGWIRYDESPVGILCKPCPVCGYKYGTSWLKEEVPQDVIDWLFSLPETTVTPAWV